MYSGPMTGNGRRRDSGSEFSQNLPDHHTARTALHLSPPLSTPAAATISTVIKFFDTNLTFHRSRQRPAARATGRGRLAHSDDVSDFQAGGHTDRSPLTNVVVPVQSQT